MRQIVYISTSAQLNSDAVRSILASASRNNPASSITGFLLYNGRNFLQLIEGPQASLASLMGRLGIDTRHNGIVRMSDIEIEHRSCPDWQMRHIRLVDAADQRQADLSEQLPEKLDPDIRRMVLNFATLN